METLNATEAHLVTLLRGPKLSDRKMCAALGLTPDQAHQLYRSLRAKLGINGAAAIDALDTLISSPGWDRDLGRARARFGELRGEA